MNKKTNLGKLLVLSATLISLIACTSPTPSSTEPTSQDSSNTSQKSDTSGDSKPSSKTSDDSEKATYKVVFNSCGGSEVEKMYVQEGKRISTAPVTTRAGYGFMGWCKSYNSKTKMGEEGTEVTFPLTVNENIVLYARWQKQSGGSHTQEEIDAYVKGLEKTSRANHVYFHYYRFDNADPTTYDDWDIWCWPYRPAEGEGARFDFVGKTTSADYLDASGTAIPDDFGGAYVDIDLTKEYDGGTSNQGHKIGGKKVSFYDQEGKLDTMIGIQIVKSSTRKTAASFWTNDGGDLHIDLTKEEEALTVDTTDGGKAWHIFAMQEHVADYGSKVINDISDPYEDDDGTNVTYGDDTYNDVNWNSTAAIQKTAPSFASGIGVGYQIQIASFADSDGDGFGDIYGITSKLDYLKKLGVKALWLTPVQKSDSYHGYDISDYEKVDVKFGSTKSTAALANGGIVTEATAMADYEELLNKAHENGMKVIMDLVLNHTSTSNRWFINSAQLNPAYRGYYQWGNHVKLPKVINEDKCWYPYGDHDYSYYAKFGSSMPELNYQYKSTREAVEDMSLFWCGKGVDGYRLDAVKHIFMTDEVTSASNDTIIYDKAAKGDYSSNLTKNLHFYRELNAAVKAKYPNCFFVGENFDGHAYHVSPWYQAFDSMFDFYGYFNLTSAAAHALGNFTQGPTFSTFMSTGGKFTLDSGIKDSGGIYTGVANSYTWDLPSVLSSYNKYRSNGRAMPGFFTSNHDIARVINRVAGTTGSSTGLDEQGTVTTGNYTKYRKASDLVKAAEILMPGLTWIYYGDEIGMTGNFPTGQTSASDYADLWWRQPMKWKQGGAVGDGSMTTGFKITGSGSEIKWDSVNASSTVVDATSQAASNSSEFAKLAQVIAYKNNNPSLITGDVSNAGSDTMNLKFRNGSITITINFSTGNVTATGGNGSLNVTF